MSKTEKHIEYYPFPILNGQKSIEETFKDGKLNGLGTEWYENGQKKYEATFKGGEIISEKCWDEDGYERECYYMKRLWHGWYE